jgi:zinc/manganese transport system ATP-binding protein
MTLALRAAAPMATPTEPVLRLDDVTLRLPGRMLVEHLSCAIGPGTFVALLGPNGAGKTTLLRAILGLVRPQSGRIAVQGALGRGSNGIGYMPQRSTGATPLAVRDVVAAAVHGTRWGLPRHSAATLRQIDAAIASVGAGHLAQRSFAALSGGERQRVLLAPALIGDPALLLLDEPLAGLDPASQASIVALVRDLQCRLGCAVLFSSHDINPLLPAMDQALYIAHGRAAIGPPDQVITAPVLSRLYGAPVRVLRAEGAIVVLPPLAAASGPGGA